jgi:hypothetical protein
LSNFDMRASGVGVDATLRAEAATGSDTRGRDFAFLRGYTVHLHVYLSLFEVWIVCTP